MPSQQHHIPKTLWASCQSKYSGEFLAKTRRHKITFIISQAGLRYERWQQLTPNAIAWPMPNFGTFRAHSGLKWSVIHILPPLLQKSTNLASLIEP